MSDVILSIAIFHCLSAFMLIGGVFVTAFASRRGLRAARRLPVIGRPILVAPRQKPVEACADLPVAA